MKNISFIGIITVIVGTLLTAYASLDTKEQEENMLHLPFNELNIDFSPTLTSPEQITEQEEKMVEAINKKFKTLREDMREQWMPYRNKTVTSRDFNTGASIQVNFEDMRKEMDVYINNAFDIIMLDMIVSERQHLLEKQVLMNSFDISKATYQEMRKIMEGVCSLDEDQMGSTQCIYYE